MQQATKRRIGTVIIVIAAIILMSAANYTKIFQDGDSLTKDLYWNSQGLVYDALVTNFQPEGRGDYGLIEMYPYNGGYTDALTDEEKGFDNGYSTTEQVIAVNKNEITEREYVPGYRMTFFTGETVTITETESDDEYLYVRYDGKERFCFDKQGSLKYIVIYNTDENRYMQIGQAVPYESQIGLQGKIYCLFSNRYVTSRYIEMLRLILVILFSSVITLIAYFIYRKYNIGFAAAFYIVSLLSSWMIGYSGNVYWVEFTWFMPMLFGIICAKYIDVRKVRILCYVGNMVSIAVKCACGYEYISTIMLGSIVFLLTELCMALFIRKDKKETVKILKVTFFMGLFALIGFMITLLIHSYMRGSGNIWHGLKSIYLYDILRRTLGGDPSMFQDVYADSLNASIIRVILMYLNFKTPLILGVPAILFIPMCVLSFVLLIVGLKKKILTWDWFFLYGWLGVTAISWFVLGKSHSYIHTMLNFVMWYFGYMQIVFYIVVKMAVEGIKRVRVTHREKNHAAE